MTSKFKFKKGDIVQIVDRWSGFADPAEYTVKDRFTTTDPLDGVIVMYEVETDGRPALIQEYMLRIVKSANPFYLVGGDY